MVPSAFTLVTVSVSARRVCASRSSRELAIAEGVVAKYFVEAGRILKPPTHPPLCRIVFVSCLRAFLDSDEYGEVCFCGPHFWCIWVSFVIDKTSHSETRGLSMFSITANGDLVIKIS